MQASTEKQIVALFVQAMRTALALIDEKQVVHQAPTVVKPQSKRKAADGIYPCQSKYNPWRAYFWDKKQHATIYLGAFPSVNKAKLAQRAYRNGQPLTEGTVVANAKLHLVQKAA